MRAPRPTLLAVGVVALTTTLAGCADDGAEATPGSSVGTADTAGPCVLDDGAVTALAGIDMQVEAPEEGDGPTYLSCTARWAEQSDYGTLDLTWSVADRVAADGEPLSAELASAGAVGESSPAMLADGQEAVTVAGDVAGSPTARLATFLDDGRVLSVDALSVERTLDPTTLQTLVVDVADTFLAG
ncbi:MAG: hypothetical protein CMH83_18850 [Nocardioides sp.]|nr:hypothetical protein [Nocardioides sp.]